MKNVTKRISAILLSLVIIFTLVTRSYQEAYANPIIYPIAEGAMYLTGTLLAAFGISLGDDTETESIRETKLAIVANALGKRIKAEWSEPDNILYRGLINLALPGAVLDLTPDQYNLFMRLGKVAYNEFTSAPNNTVPYDTGFVANTDNIISTQTVNTPALSNGESWTSDVLYDFFYNAYQNGTYRVKGQTSIGGLKYVLTVGGKSYMYNNGMLDITFTSGSHVISVYGQYDTDNQYRTVTYDTHGILPTLRLYSSVVSSPTPVYRSLGFTVYYNPYISGYTGNVISDVKSTIDTSVVVCDTYSLPDTDGKKKVAIPQALSDFGTKVKTVSDVIPKAETENPPAEEPLPEFKYPELKVPADVLKNKFPFSIPWDLKNAVSGLAASPVAPKWTINFPSNIFVGGGQLVIDFAQFETWAMIVRWGILIIFNIFLILSTRKIIGAS